MRVSSFVLLHVARRVLFVVPLAWLLLMSAPPDGMLPAYDRARAGAMPFLVGVHAPNRPFNQQDYARVAEGELGAVKMMGYHPSASYERLRAEIPDLRFFVRLFTPWNELPSPEQFVAQNAPHLRTLVDAGYAPWVEIGNEPNLELHPLAEATFGEWYLRVLEGLRAAVPEARYGFPGLARDLRELDWLAQNTAAIEASDWLGAHAYWHDEREMLNPRGALLFTQFHRRFPAVPIVVTEAGNLENGVSSAQRAREYVRFSRALAQLPYVHAVHFFILSGTEEWRRFFFDQTMIAALRRAGSDPLPPWATFLGLREPSRRRLGSLAEPAPLPPPVPSASVLSTPTPTPTPEPFFRRRLLVDPAPARASVFAPAPAARWARLAPAPAPAAALRTASAYTITDFSARVLLAPPESGVPFALQVAERDVFAAGTSNADAVPSAAVSPRSAALSELSDGASPSESATGFALLWDGERWRLQYRRAGRLLSNAPLAGVPDAAALAGEWLSAEVAIEPRSAAAWIWRASDPQPEHPNAVFAPPEEAALDGARARALFLPAHPITDLLLEGATRYS